MPYPKDYCPLCGDELLLNNYPYGYECPRCGAFKLAARSDDEAALRKFPAEGICRCRLCAIFEFYINFGPGERVCMTCRGLPTDNLRILLKREGFSDAMVKMHLRRLKNGVVTSEKVTS